MSAGLRWGLRARLVVAFVGVALLAAGLATVFSTFSLSTHVESAATSRLQRAAEHFGRVAGVVYTDSGGWTESALAELRHLAEMDDLSVRVVDSAGHPVMLLPPGAPVEAGASVTISVTTDARPVGSVTVSQANGQLLTAEETALLRQLNRMHLIAGFASALVALAVALLLALTLSRPLRQIRAGAEAMGAGELDARVEETGDAEIRAVAKALNRLAETLKQEESLRKASVADLAHELRTPVMGLLGRIEAAQDGVLQDEARNLLAMHDEATRLGRLLDDLSALADAERPGTLLGVEPVDLAEIADGQASVFADRFAEKGITLRCDLLPTVVEGDRRRLEQIVVNLLANALRYTDAGGHVDLVVRRAGGDAVLEVVDTGIGIAAGDIPQVFLRFWRGERSRSRETGGAGIGLSIVHALVQAHGGRITVESEVGVGSVFRVVFPVVDPVPQREG